MNSEGNDVIGVRFAKGVRKENRQAHLGARSPGTELAGECIVESEFFPREAHGELLGFKKEPPRRYGCFHVGYFRIRSQYLPAPYQKKPGAEGKGIARPFEV